MCSSHSAGGQVCAGCPSVCTGAPAAWEPGLNAQGKCATEWGHSRFVSDAQSRRPLIHTRGHTCPVAVALMHPLGTVIVAPVCYLTLAHARHVQVGVQWYIRVSRIGGLHHHRQRWFRCPEREEGALHPLGSSLSPAPARAVSAEVKNILL